MIIFLLIPEWYLFLITRKIQTSVSFHIENSHNLTLQEFQSPIIEWESLL